jgi:hypothetical protein
MKERRQQAGEAAGAGATGAAGSAASVTKIDIDLRESPFEVPPP